MKRERQRKRENREVLSRYKTILIETNNVTGVPSQQKHRTKVKVAKKKKKKNYALAPTGLFLGLILQSWYKIY